MGEEGSEPKERRCDGDQREEEDDEAYIAGGWVCHACEDRVVEPWPWREPKIPRRFMKEATAPTDRQIPEPVRIKTRSRHRPDAIDTAPITSRSVFQKMRIPNINLRCCAKSGQSCHS